MPWKLSELRLPPISPRDKLLSEISEGGALFSSKFSDVIAANGDIMSERFEGGAHFLPWKAKRLVEITRKEED